MGSWQSKLLGEFIELKRGYDLPSRDRIPGPFPLITSSGPTEFVSQPKVSGPGVVTGRYGTVGQIFYVQKDFWPLNTALYVRNFRGNDPRFVYYFLHGIDWEKYNDKSGVPGINRNDVHREIILVPSLEIQVQIVSALSALDDKIELNRRMNETLEAMAQAIFRDWFVDFGPVRRKLAGATDPLAIMGGVTSDPSRAAELAALFPDGMTEVGQPESFRCIELGDAVSVLETGTRPKGGIKGIESGVPSIGAESIVGLAKFDFGKTKFVPRAFFTGMKRGVLGGRDVLLYKDGGRPGEFEPHVAFFGGGFPFEESCINEHVYRIVAAKPFSQEYLYLHLTSEASLDEMRNKGTGVAIPGLNSTAAKSLTILHPGAALLGAFAAAAKPLIDAALRGAAESRTLAETRDYLLPRLMSGEVSVRDAEQLVEDAA